jgi:hypothetical protein
MGLHFFYNTLSLPEAGNYAHRLRGAMAERGSGYGIVAEQVEKYSFPRIVFAKLSQPLKLYANSVSGAK